MRPAVLTIAGSDPSGGAGLQADLQTFSAFGAHGCAVPTALTVQDTRGVLAVHVVDPAIVEAQLAAVLADVHVSAIKIGILPTAHTITIVQATLARHRGVPVVVDPILRASSGMALGADDPAATYRVLWPSTTVVTPNIHECAALTGQAVTTIATMRDAGRRLLDAGVGAVLVTGGHLSDRACDVLVTRDAVQEYDAPRHPHDDVHGTGCALSAAIAVGLAEGMPLPVAVARAKRWIGRAIAGATHRGHGRRTLAFHVTPD